MKSELMPFVKVEGRIFVCRGKKVMVDRDLAALYQVETRVLVQAVHRHLERFPEDFMFQLNKGELENWRSQIVISNADRKGLRWKPYVFTEQGIAMLSGVLNSQRAILVNIQIMRTFTRLREMAEQNDWLRLKVEAMEKQYDDQFRVVFDAIHRLLDEPPTDASVIGFNPQSNPYAP